MARLALAQITSSECWEENLKKAEQWMKRASEQGADMIVFPEYFMMYYPAKRVNYHKGAQTLYGPFVSEMKRLAEKYHIWTVFSMNEDSIQEGKSYNTTVILDDHAVQKAIYRKNHLFDAYTWQESTDTIKGEKMFLPLRTPIGVLGISVCYDLRFPETARIVALYGAEVMIYPSAWVKGEGKFLAWETLLRARAIENEMFVFGCCHFSEEHYMGRSLGFGPLGEKILEGKEREELLFCEFDSEKIKKVRHENPVFKNRRTDLYSVFLKER